MVVAATAGGAHAQKRVLRVHVVQRVLDALARPAQLLARSQPGQESGGKIQIQVSRARASSAERSVRGALIRGRR